MKLTKEQLAKMIDHTLLKPNTIKRDVIKICEEARAFHFATVCVNPIFVPLASKLLKGSDVRVCTVIAFPLGAATTETKVFEAENAIKNGARELDMVINITALKSGDYELVRQDIEAIVKKARSYGDVITKVIIETGYLTDEEKVKACIIAKEAGADYVKTSTGFGPGGATVHDVKLMRKTVGEGMGVKAAGGIRSLEDVIKMIEAGANRIGTSSALKIMEGL